MESAVPQIDIGALLDGSLAEEQRQSDGRIYIYIYTIHYAIGALCT